MDLHCIGLLYIQLSAASVLIKVLSIVYCLWRCDIMPSVLWRCQLGGRKGIRPVKNWVMGCWHGYLARCRFAYGPADTTATHCLLHQKSRLILVLPFWYWLTRVVPDKI